MRVMGWAEVIVAHRLLVAQPDVLRELVRCRLLSIRGLAEILGLAPPADVQTSQTERLMRHDAYRRVRGRIQQARWGA